jgi:imidazolonepropionase-like amidohydrolase
MHVHAGEIEEDWFALYLANGVTGLREMAASENHLVGQRRYRDELAAGKRIGPRLFWTGRPIDRQGPDAPAPFGVRTAEEARAAVRHLRSLRASHVKVYSRLTREAYLAILEEAAKYRLPVTRHVPDAISPFEAAVRGQRSIEHLDAAAGPEACESAPVDPRLRYVRPDYLEWWRQSLRQAPGPWQDQANFRNFRQIVRALAEHGVPILAGTDTPNPFCLPGFALHDELRLLVEAGLTPAAALRAATSSPARLLGLADSGTIAPGRRADLVLLEANPLADIRNTTRITAVAAAGRWFDRAALDAMLSKVEAAVCPR